MKLNRLFKHRPFDGKERERLIWRETPSSVYAVGDVHGCLDLLIDLERQVLEDAKNVPGRSVLIYLGDLVDRGPNSAGVLDHLVSAEETGLERVTLCGNHEAMFLQFLSRPSLGSKWLSDGGLATLNSYGIAIEDVRNSRQLKLQLAACVPREHRSFLQALPLSLELPGYFFAHAGIDPRRRLADQRVEDLLTIRQGFLDASGPFDKCVVHGHTPFAAVQVTSHRISIDTGAYGTGVLSAVRLSPSGGIRVLTSSQESRSSGCESG